MANELYHWKYIRKEKVNGKWKYYYDDGTPKVNNYFYKDADGVMRNHSAPEPKETLKEKLKRGGGIIADKLGADEKKAYKTAKIREDAAKRVYQKTSKGVDDALETLQTGRRSGQVGVEAGNKAKLSVAKDNKFNAGVRLQEAETERVIAEFKYNKTVLGVTERVVNKGKDFVDYILRKRKK